ncbi:hypothetical protein TNCV_4904861 [Trichonephila clavipes]|uniref:RNA-directed DNA polymerase from mobile element jockey n=1 Tax=Trichonephila clavipes TaxID=2585209 RepID=A0A8X6RNS1_TRICX|nr:hypothetical protein TNCV_4904861 [Trichonephila clavipes]
MIDVTFGANWEASFGTLKSHARTNNSKLWSIAKSLSRDRPQVEVCNTILTEDGFPPNEDKATANVLGSHYQKISRPTFNKADKNTQKQAKLAVHKCRSSDHGEPVLLADFSRHELLLVLNALYPKKSPWPDNIYGVMITHLGPRVIRVKYNKSLSKDFLISQGVSQGSVLSPTLFSVLLAGVEKLFTENSSIGLFVDSIVLWYSSHDILRLLRLILPSV